MADSNITKKALAAALKGLMEEEEFTKISVADICNRCDMNRKSFYYHFKDKYDLVNWIFDIEFFKIIEEKSQSDAWEIIEVLCEYFYDNKKFYRSALKIKGQNSFEEHFIELMIPIIESRIQEILGDGETQEFYVNFCIDAFIGSMKRWILDKKDLPPEKFTALLKSCINLIVVSAEKEK